MGQITQIVLSLNQAIAFDRRAFDGMTSLANERSDIRLLRREYGQPIMSSFAGQKIDGMILTRAIEPALLHELSRAGTPFVVLCDSEKLDSPHAYVLGMDDAAIGQMAAEHFLNAGYRHFCVACRPSVRGFFSRRIEGFMLGIGEAGYTAQLGPTESTKGSDFDDISVWDSQLDSYLKQLPKPLAVFAPYDYYAHGVVNAARVAGIRVPDDVAVLGVDDDELYCMTTSPQLCSVITPGRQIGQQALALMLNILAGKPDILHRTLVQPPGIMFRGTAIVSAVKDPDVIDAVRFIRANAARTIGVSEVAAHVMLSRRTLERRFITTLKHTIQDEIRRARVNDAKRLLTDTDLPFADVARRSGLNQRQYLNRLIKQATGLTPMQYRISTRKHR